MSPRLAEDPSRLWLLRAGIRRRECWEQTRSSIGQSVCPQLSFGSDKCKGSRRNGQLAISEGSLLEGVYRDGALQSEPVEAELSTQLAARVQVEEEHGSSLRELAKG